MRFVLAGAERGASRNLLLSHPEVERVGVNFTQLNVPVSKPFSVPDKFSGREVFVYTSEKDEDMDAFDAFLRAHHEHLYAVVSPPGYDGDWLDAKNYPLWNDKEDLERLAHLCERYGRVAVSDKALNTSNIDRLKKLAHRWNCSVILLSSRPDVIEAVDADYVVVTNWNSVMRFGETQVWDGFALRRYAAQQKVSVRKKHRADISRLGVDPDEVLNDEVEAVASLAIKSWLAWEMRAYHVPEHYSQESIGGADSNYSNPLESDSLEDRPGSSLAISAPERRHESDRKLLPILGVYAPSEDGSESQQTLDNIGEAVSGQGPKVVRSDANLRQCDSCYLSARCPEFRPSAECAYKFPVELKTQDQIMAMLRLIMEQQFERTMFAAFAEQLEGQGADPTVSKEFDRVFSMVEKFKAISDNRDYFSITIEGKQQAGVLERVFGSKVAEKVQELPQPVDSNRVIEELGVVDAEVVEG